MRLNLIACAIAHAPRGCVCSRRSRVRPPFTLDLEEGRMATRSEVGRRAERASDRLMGVHDETRWGVLTGEFWTMVAAVVAVLIAAAVADNFGARSAWWIV